MTIAQQFVILNAGKGGGSSLGPQWVPKPRAPLGPFPVGSGPYPRVPAVTPPAGRDLRYYRGQFCGLHIPGAPVVPGCNAARPEVVMSCLLDNYPADFRRAYLTQYAEDGYTHLQRSVGHALGYGSTLDQYIELCKRARGDFGLLCDHWLVANELPGFQKGQPVSYWQTLLTPIIDRLLSSGTVDLVCCGWQMDQWLNPGNDCLDYIAFVGGRVPGEIPVYTHWMNEALAWWADGGDTWDGPDGPVFVHDRFTFWQAIAPFITGGHYQGNTKTARKDPKLFQDRMLDTLDPMCWSTGKGYFGLSRRGGTPRPFVLDAWEITGQEQFNTYDPAEDYGGCSEDEGDLDGYCATCATSIDAVGRVVGGPAGYGNGARRPDGTAL